MSHIAAFTTLIENIIDEKNENIHSTKIAQVVSYDAETNTCSVQPVTQFLRVSDANNEEWVNLPQINDITVKQNGSGKLWQTTPPTEGSYGVLMVTDDDISNWLDSGGIAPTGSSTRHNFSNGYFAPGALPFIEDGKNGKLVEPVAIDRISFRTRSNLSEISVIEDESIVVKNEKSTISIAADNTITISNENATIEIAADGAIDVNSGVIEIASGGTVTINGNLEVLA